ncbi:nucleic acid-binding domain protein [Candidatus Nitrosopumilus salaria BD31]|uniref:Nucleic acid-binding domain protein n=1 Tax=Candidatus Nitrosopumilus salarius BD31 TaxID=859350 RepID=I3CZZ3_9ARCH|nr:nucleic acid-binding protein [Candidatus Nitrosopumilus salaria]EIJ65036.1 nucleic acid-binding domain protein [Candidatus Nitrosopumilus salaria BD31]
MKILIPENTLLWSTKGVCFPKDLTYGTEIFTIDPNNKFVLSPIMEDLEEPEPMKVITLLTKNNISTVIPTYKIQTNEKFIDLNKVNVGDKLSFVDSKHLEKFKEYQDDHTLEFLEKSPFSVMGVSYLGSCGLKESKEAVYFQRSDEESMRVFAKEIQESMTPEFGGDVWVTKGVVSQSKWGRKDVSFLVLYRSEKFYKFRKSIKLIEDKILNSIYLNGINIFFGFLRSLLNGGFAYHLNSFVRGVSENKYVILYLPWKSKTRKLLQNSCNLWNTYQLSICESKSQMNIDETKIEKKIQPIFEQTILEIKEHLIDCYEIEIQIGNKIICDNIVLKPFELTEDEISELQKFEETPDFDLEKIRKKITLSIISNTNTLKTINQIKQLEKAFHLHIVGIIKNKGTIMPSVTRYGKTYSTNAILSDESGEIKLKIWGDIVNEIKNGDVLELVGAYIKNGILRNSNDGYEKIYKIKDEG